VDEAAADGAVVPLEHDELEVAVAAAAEVALDDAAGAGRAIGDRSDPRPVLDRRVSAALVVDQLVALEHDALQVAATAAVPEVALDDPRAEAEAHLGQAAVVRGDVAGRGVQGALRRRGRPNATPCWSSWRWLIARLLAATSQPGASHVAPPSTERNVGTKPNATTRGSIGETAIALL
jgi:hypothetical protein